MALLPHQERVVVEHDELLTKLLALTSFIHSPKFFELVPEEVERELLIRQSDVMTDYCRILSHRIESFDK